MSKEKLYATRDLDALCSHYFRHVEAMTAEGLHEKSRIAAELAHRDAQIAELTKQRDGYRSEWEHERQRHIVTRCELDARRQRDMDEIWYWQGDGEDYPESLTCPVLIRADDLRLLLSASGSSPASPPSSKEVGR